MGSQPALSQPPGVRYRGEAVRGQGAPGALGVRVGWSGSSGTRQGGPGWDTIPDADAPGCRREGEPSEGVRGGSVSALSWPGLGCTGCLSHGAGSRGPVPPRAPQTPGGFAVGSPPHHCELPESGCEEREEEAPWAAWGRVGTGCLKGSRGRHVGVAKQRSALPWLSREAGVLFSHFTDGEGETRSGARGPCEDGGGGRAEEEGCGHLWEGWQALGSALRPLIWRMRAEVTDV